MKKLCETLRYSLGIKDYEIWGFDKLSLTVPTTINH